VLLTFLTWHIGWLLGIFCRYHKSCLLVVGYEYVCMHISLYLGAFTKIVKNNY